MKLGLLVTTVQQLPRGLPSLFFRERSTINWIILRHQFDDQRKTDHRLARIADGNWIQSRRWHFLLIDSHWVRRHTLQREREGTSMSPRYCCRQHGYLSNEFPREKSILRQRPLLSSVDRWSTRKNSNQPAAMSNRRFYWMNGLIIWIIEVEK